MNRNDIKDFYSILIFILGLDGFNSNGGILTCLNRARVGHTGNIWIVTQIEMVLTVRCLSDAMDSL